MSRNKAMTGARLYALCKEQETMGYDSAPAESRRVRQRLVWSISVTKIVPLRRLQTAPRAMEVPHLTIIPIAVHRFRAANRADGKVIRPGGQWMGMLIGHTKHQPSVLFPPGSS